MSVAVAELLPFEGEEVAVVVAGGGGEIAVELHETAHGSIRDGGADSFEYEAVEAAALGIVDRLGINGVD